MPELNITDEQRANLVRLAEYLDRSVPPPEFGMRSFCEFGAAGCDLVERHIAEFAHGDKRICGHGHAWPGYIPLEAYTACGTVACAVGHGPLAGIEAMQDETWFAYSHRVFGVHGEEWEFLFSADWAPVDDTAPGAAARIRYLLEHGDVPTVREESVVVHVYSFYRMSVHHFDRKRRRDLIDEVVSTYSAYLAPAHEGVV